MQRNIAADACRHLGEALRAVLVLEARKVTVKAQAATQKVPAHLPPGCSAVSCDIETPSGAEARVVLGGPQEGKPDSTQALVVTDIDSNARGSSCSCAMHGCA